VKKLIPLLLVLQLTGTAAALGWLLLRPKEPHAAEPAAAAAEAPAGHAAAEACPPGGLPAGHGDGKGEGAGAAAAGEQVVAHLVEGNKRFVAGEHQAHPIVNERKALSAAQHPGAIILSCSDSRVPPELVFDQSLGEVFVVRTAGNVADPIVLGSMEYAAEHLHSKALIVLGHEKCGAVTAATQDGELSSPNLRALVGAIAPTVKPLRAKAQGAELVHLGVEANVEASLKHVLESSALLKELVEKKELTVKRAIYDLDSGAVRFW
jgi:carbonic anhydrase